MASKVLVKLPSVSFPQSRKPSPAAAATAAVTGDIVPLAERNDGLGARQQQQHQQQQPKLQQQLSPTAVAERAAQLEQSVRFLQEQHQTTLAALHREVELLREKNRDLQFQLVFSKGTACVPSSPSSPEDNSTGFAKSKGSPICPVNVTPLHVELLEKDLQDTKLSLQEAKAQNQRLADIIEAEKMQLAKSPEGECKSEMSSTDVGIQVGGKFDPVRTDLAANLKVAEAKIKRLRRKNEEQRQEIATLRANSGSNATSAITPVASTSAVSPSAPPGVGQPPGTDTASETSTVTSPEQASFHKFPPLQSQSYSHRRLLRSGKNRHDKQEHRSDPDANAGLPELQNGTSKATTEGPTLESSFYRGRSYRNHYRDEGNSKYRGHRQRERREPSDHHQPHQQQKQQQHYYHQQHLQQGQYRRDYKERNARDRQRYQLDVGDSTRGSRDNATE